jgi:hypothetical protein
LSYANILHSIFYEITAKAYFVNIFFIEGRE